LCYRPIRIVPDRADHLKCVSQKSPPHSSVSMLEPITPIRGSASQMNRSVLTVIVVQPTAETAVARQLLDTDDPLARTVVPPAEVTVDLIGPLVQAVHRLGVVEGTLRGVVNDPLGGGLDRRLHGDHRVR